MTISFLGGNNYCLNCGAPKIVVTKEEEITRQSKCFKCKIEFMEVYCKYCKKKVDVKLLSDLKTTPKQIFFECKFGHTIDGKYVKSYKL